MSKMSTKGQVVIPEEIRESLNLTPGLRFMVIGSKDGVIFKAINPPTASEFGSLMKKSQALAKTKGFKPSDVKKAIKQARKTLKSNKR